MGLNQRHCPCKGHALPLSYRAIEFLLPLLHAERNMPTVVKIVPSFRGVDGVALEKVRAFWRTNRPEANPELATVCILDLCDEVERLLKENAELQERQC